MGRIRWMEIKCFPSILSLPRLCVKYPECHVQRCESVFSVSVNCYAVRVENEWYQDFLTISCTITVILPCIYPPTTMMKLLYRRILCQRRLPYAQEYGVSALGNERLLSWTRSVLVSNEFNAFWKLRTVSCCGFKSGNQSSTFCSYRSFVMWGSRSSFINWITLARPLYGLQPSPQAERSDAWYAQS